MQHIVRWMKDALTTKRIVLEMSYFKFQNGEVKATDGRITAGHPWDGKDEFLVPGAEFEKTLSRMGDNVTIVVDDEFLTVKSGRSRGVISTLPIDSWDYPGVEEIEHWEPFPAPLLPALRTLVPFVSTNATHDWSLGVTLEDGWCYATNNVALAGVKVPSIGTIDVILPIWTIEFLLDHQKGITHWAWTDDFVAFKWDNGAWMRSVLIDGKFPPQASNMIQAAAQELPDVLIDEDFLESFNKVASLTEGSISISGNEMSSSFGKAAIIEGFDIPELDTMVTFWGAKFLVPVIQVAKAWSPQRWPKPAPFQGDGIVGYVMGATK